MKFHMIHPWQISELEERERAVVIDVRAPGDYARFHYPDAVNCPYEKMDMFMKSFPKSRLLIFYCEHGSTSLLAARRFAREGYRVAAVNGGIKSIEKYMDKKRGIS